MSRLGDFFFPSNTRTLGLGFFYFFFSFSSLDAFEDAACGIEELLVRPDPMPTFTGRAGLFLSSPLLLLLLLLRLLLLLFFLDLLLLSELEPLLKKFSPSLSM